MQHRNDCCSFIRCSASFTNQRVEMNIAMSAQRQSVCKVTMILQKWHWVQTEGSSRTLSQHISSAWPRPSHHFQTSIMSFSLFFFAVHEDGTDLMRRMRNYLFFHMPVLVIAFSGRCQILPFANEGHMFPQRKAWQTAGWGFWELGGVLMSSQPVRVFCHSVVSDCYYISYIFSSTSQTNFETNAH